MIKIKKIPIGEKWEDRLLIAVDENDQVLGSARVWDNFSKLTELYVIPKHRQEKIAEMLLVEGATMAKMRGHKVILGYCKKRLLPFYYQYGLRVIKEPGEGEDLYTVEYPIPE